MIAGGAGDRAVLTDDGVGLRAVIQGTGPALVLCHGGPGLWDYLDDLASMLEDLVRIWRYDQRGCGRSGGVDGPYTAGSALMRDRLICEIVAGEMGRVGQGSSVTVYTRT